MDWTGLELGIIIIIIIAVVVVVVSVNTQGIIFPSHWLVAAQRAALGLTLTLLWRRRGVDSSLRSRRRTEDEEEDNCAISSSSSRKKSNWNAKAEMSLFIIILLLLLLLLSLSLFLRVCVYFVCIMQATCLLLLRECFSFCLSVGTSRTHKEDSFSTTRPKKKKKK